MDGFGDKAKTWVNNAIERGILTQAEADELCAANEEDILDSGDTDEAMRATVAQMFTGPGGAAVEAAKAEARASQDSRRNVKCNPAYQTNPPVVAAGVGAGAGAGAAGAGAAGVGAGAGAAGAGAEEQAGGRRRRKSKRPRRKVRKSKRRSRK
jgi:hypothetical protein